jgi:hypothetical protein
VHNILSIHLPVNASIDKWTWAPSPSGTFSVKSAHAAWLSLWGLKLQARLKHLLWKVAWDILPSRAKIGNFVVSEDPSAWLCPFCKGPLETLPHIFLECDLARILWRSLPWPISFLAYSSRPISDWIAAILSPVEAFGITKSDSRNFQLFIALTLDQIWRCRNLLIHEGVLPSPIKIIHQVSCSFKFHLEAWNSKVLPALWLPPAKGWVKLNFDVAVKGSFSVAATVVSDEKGDVLNAATQKLHGSDALQGEAHAALLAVRLADSMGCKLITLEGDALLVILAINNPPLFSSWNFANCLADISLVLSSFQSWVALKVSRCANFRAHVLGKWAASHHVFGSIPTGSTILSSLRIRSGKDPPL